MRMRVWIAVVCFCLIVVAMVTADSDDLLTFQVDPHGGLSFPQLPSPTDGSALQRKILDSQPYVFKTSDRLLHEAEISRDMANKEFEESMEKTTEDMNNLDETKRRGLHYTVDQTKQLWHLPGSGPYPGEGRRLYTDAMADYELANKQYDAALAATGDKDYERQARIFDSAAGMYSTLGDTKAQEQVENAALAAHARAAAESLPLPAWLAVAGLFGAYALIAKKRG